MTENGKLFEINFKLNHERSDGVVAYQNIKQNTLITLNQYIN